MNGFKTEIKGVMMAGMTQKNPQALFPLWSLIVIGEKSETK